MAYASYRLHRIGWVAWRWVADYRGEVGGKGVALTEGAARSAARAWLRAMADADGSVDAGEPEPGPLPVVRPRAPERPLRDRAVMRSSPAVDHVAPAFGRRAAGPVQHGRVGAS